MHEQVLLVGRGAPDTRIVDAVGDVEVANEAVAGRARAREASTRPLEGDRRLRHRRRVVAARGDDADEAVVERAAVVTACLEMPFDRPDVAHVTPQILSAARA
jgi:hypothetical protein